MKPVPYEDAVDLLDADHKAVQKLFIDFNALCDDDAAPDAKRQIAEKICQSLLVHAQIEEEIFYPAVRSATGDKPLIEDAIDEHAQAKETIAQIQAMAANEPDYDNTVKRLGGLIDAHVLEEREQTFLEARQSSLGLRRLAVELFERKNALKTTGASKPAAKRPKVTA
jgi:hemerythrin superfamily protein